jgi:hypothetical protein
LSNFFWDPQFSKILKMNGFSIPYPVSTFW